MSPGSLRPTHNGAASRPDGVDRWSQRGDQVEKQVLGGATTGSGRGRSLVAVTPPPFPLRVA